MSKETHRNRRWSWSNLAGQAICTLLGIGAAAFVAYALLMSGFVGLNSTEAIVFLAAVLGMMYSFILLVVSRLSPFPMVTACLSGLPLAGFCGLMWWRIQSDIQASVREVAPGWLVACGLYAVITLGVGAFSSWRKPDSVWIDPPPP